MRRLNTDDSVEENPSNLVLGMGIGVLVIFIFCVVLFLIWGLSTHCDAAPKIIWRSFSTLLFGITMLILIFAERESRFYYTNYETVVYDDSVIPRISIACVLMVFALLSLRSIIIVSGESKEESTNELDFNALWSSRS